MTASVLETSPQLTLPRLDDAGRALLFTEARTANSFATTPVTDEELSEIWELAKWAPTSANVQPLRVVYVTTPEGRERLGDGGFLFAPTDSIRGFFPDWYQASYQTPEHARATFGASFEVLGQIPGGVGGYQDVVLCAKPET